MKGYIWTLREKRAITHQPPSYNHWWMSKNMIALVDLHISHGGQPSHISQSLRSKIPSSNLSMRWMSVMLPDRVLARILVVLLTNPCFKCLKQLTY
ncbi:hypothetical protein BWZ43_14840 [Heyndrickxia oleronia]|uniref:Uncharacterized protein n=1 Tax=Heyndrickxia oleronia TaxID=38875 RepID=A0A8E2I6G0_9BACI|nr:hypothetical protein BWZ43_14840 [Heyndrickxia oleronia]